MFRYYILTIVLGILLLTVFCCLFAVPAFGFSIAYAAVMPFLSAVAVFAIDAAVAEIVRLLPKKLYHPFRKRFRVFRFEKRLYKKLGIDFWKDKIPETGGLLVHFPKNHVADLHDNAYLFRFMEETCYAEVMHLWSIPCGYLAVFLCPLRYAVCFGIPVATVNAVLQFLPILVQRYVRPQLMRVYLGNEKREKRKQAGKESGQTDDRIL